MNKIVYQTFHPRETLPPSTILPDQTHSSNIIEIKTGKEVLDNCDGLWTRNKKFSFGVTTADCAPICFWNNEIHGVIHAGWRGTVNGLIENLKQIEKLNSPFNIWVGPIFPSFEIQKDECYQSIQSKFGDQFFEIKENKIIFNFKDCLEFYLPTANFDPRSTFTDPLLASWRRDKNFDRGKNITVIGSF